MNKYIFLDIDGVLNSEEWYEERAHVKYPQSEFCPKNIELLNDLIEKTGAEVIISSCWRIGETVENLQGIMESCGFKHTIKDFTPVLSFGKGWNSVPRGAEIQEWLWKNAEYDYHQTVRYVIIDDDGDMLLDQAENFFQTDRRCGLSVTIVYKAARFLNRA